MSIEQFKLFVADDLRSFSGVNPEAQEALQRAELMLGCRLPETLKWLLFVHGYSLACGVSSLEDTVSITLRCRDKLSLPPRYIVLNDWGDGGVVYLDSESGVVMWADSSVLYDLADGKHSPSDGDVYADYTAWAAARMEAAADDEEA